MAKRWTIERVQTRSNEIHNNKFIIYDILSGKNERSLNIKCKKCNNSFVVSINNHINKERNCKYCLGKTTLSTNDVQKKSNILHNNKFIIHNTIIKKIGLSRTGSYANVECKICGHKFEITVSNHLSNDRGCGGLCSGVNNRKLQIEILKNNHTLANENYMLYFLKFTHKITNEQFYKIGKTKLTIKQRFRYIQYNNYIIEEVSLINSTHLWVAEQEDKFLNNFKKYKYEPLTSFPGHTECFKKEVYRLMFNK
jgi:hypothetical protein